MVLWIGSLLASAFSSFCSAFVARVADAITIGLAPTDRLGSLVLAPLWLGRFCIFLLFIFAGAINRSALNGVHLARGLRVIPAIARHQMAPAGSSSPKFWFYEAPAFP